MSLIELSLAFFLTAILLSLLIMFFLSLVRNSDRTVTRARLQQSAALALMHLIQDLQRANAGGLSFLPDQEGRMPDLVIHPVEDISGDGLPMYSDQELVHFHLEAEARVLKRRAFSRRFPSPLPLRSGEPMRFRQEHVAMFLAQPAEERFFRETRELRIYTPGVDPQFVGNPLRVSLVVEAQAVPGAPPERVECTRAVVLRNSL